MALYGYPTIILRDKDTGKIKKEISCKNIQTIPARMLFSGRYYNSKNGPVKYKIGNRDNSNRSVFVYTLPYRMPKTPYFAIMAPEFNEYRYISDRQYPFSYPSIDGINNVELKQDASSRSLLVYRGILNPPANGVRDVGTICLRMGIEWDTETYFYTPLDEVVRQDSTTTIDISYKIIVGGNTPREYAYNHCSFYGGVSKSSDHNTWAGSQTAPPEVTKNMSKILSGLNWPEGEAGSVCSGIYSGVNDTLYNSIYPESGDSDYSVGYTTYTHGLGSPSYRVRIQRDKIAKCGIFIGSVGINTNASLTDKDILRISNGKGVSTTFNKRRDAISSAIRPFFDASSIKNGDGAVKAISATEKRGFPERWEIDVLKSGTLSTAEFRIRKTIVSGYEMNSNIAIPMFVDHLSYEGAIGYYMYSKYNHPDGRLYESSPAVWPLYGQNIAIVIRKGVLLTSVGNARYVILDETNLPHDNRGVQITGIAWDDSKKGLLIGCGESGLYRVDFDNDTDNEPAVRRVTKDGIEHVYAISGNGKGHVAIVTDAGIMYSDNLGDTWNTKTFETVKSQISGVNDYTDSYDYVEMFKHRIFCFLLSRDGSSVRVTDKRQYYRSNCLNIKLASSEKATIGGENYDSYTYSDTTMGPNADNNFNFSPICLSQTVAETEGKTLKELISSDKYAIQPNVCLGMSADGTTPAILPYYFVNIANGSISSRRSMNISNETFSQVNSHYERFVMEDGSIVSVRDNRIGVIVHNGRWGVWLRKNKDGSSKIRTYVVGATLHHSKDSPTLFEYYDSTSNTFKRGESGLKYTPASPDVAIDGVKLKFSGETFEAGDCFIFHRTMSYVDDNVSTFDATMEKSVLKKSEWVEKSGTISEEMPKPIYRHPICTYTNMYKTQDNRLKTKDRTFTDIKNIAIQSPQYRTSGGAKFKFDLSRFKGGFLIYIVSGMTDDQGASIYQCRYIYVAKNGSDILYYCFGESKYYDYYAYRYDSAAGVLFSDDNKLRTTNLYVTVDHEKRGITVNDGDRVIWTSGSSAYNDKPTYDIRIVPLNICMRGSNLYAYTFNGDISRHNDVTWINDEAEIQLPTFEYCYKGALCTQLGDEAALTGVYDPVFYGTPGIMTDDSMVVEIDSKPAKARYFYANQDSYSAIAGYSMLKPGVSSRGGVSVDMAAGNVLIDTYMGIMYFSDEDIGKPYRIRYKYYKGDSLGIGEAILE